MNVEMKQRKISDVNKKRDIKKLSKTVDRYFYRIVCTLCILTVIYYIFTDEDGLLNGLMGFIRSIQDHLGIYLIFFICVFFANIFVAVLLSSLEKKEYTSLGMTIISALSTLIFLFIYIYI